MPRNNRRKAFLFSKKSFIPCYYCDENLTFKQATIEHLIPISSGGSNSPDNLVISCRFCNNCRHDINPNQWKILMRNHKKNIIEYFNLVKRIKFRLFEYRCLK